MIRLPRWLQMALALAAILVITTPSRADHIARGKIKNVAADRNEFAVTDDKGKEWTFQGAQGTKVLLPGNKDGKLSDLKPGTEVSVLADEQGGRNTAMAILSHEGANQNAQLSYGTVKSATDNQIVISDAAAKDQNYEMQANARTRLNDKPARLSELKAGDKVVFVYEKQGTRNLIRDICSERK